MIKGKNVDLWPLERYDLLINLKWANDRELINLTGMPRFPKSMIEMENWYNISLKQTANKFYTIKTKSGEYIGNMELNYLDWQNRCLELGILIGKRDCRGKGYGTDATVAILNFIFEQLDFHRVYLHVIEYNKDAIKLYEKCGFVREGIKREAYYHDGKYWDVIQMGLLKREFMEIKNNKFKEYFEVMSNE